MPFRTSPSKRLSGSSAMFNGASSPKLRNGLSPDPGKHDGENMGATRPRYRPVSRSPIRSKGSKLDGSYSSNGDCGRQDSRPRSAARISVIGCNSVNMNTAASGNSALNTTQPNNSSNCDFLLPGIQRAARKSCTSQVVPISSSGYDSDTNTANNNGYSNGTKCEKADCDHDRQLRGEMRQTFVKSFSHPTKIYKYLATHQTPFLLHRNLYYMKRLRPDGLRKRYVPGNRKSRLNWNWEEFISKRREKSSGANRSTSKKQIDFQTPSKQPPNGVSNKSEDFKALGRNPNHIGKTAISPSKFSPRELACYCAYVDCSSFATPDVDEVMYCFVLKDVVHQTTIPTDNFTCPWCQVRAPDLYALLKHLRLLHPRFCFFYIPNPKKPANIRIDVTLNEHFNTSYSGNPQDLARPTCDGFFARDGPTRRTPFTWILPRRPRHRPCTLKEFMPNSDDPFSQLAFIRPQYSGHNRLYYSSTNTMPLDATQLDEDSEDEVAPEWMKIKTQLMIDDYADVNEGEKAIMKLWNLHLMKYRITGDCQIAQTMRYFIWENFEQIHRMNLYNNFLLHLCNMCDYRLLTPADMCKFVSLYQHLVGEKVVNTDPSSTTSSNFVNSLI